MWVILLKKSKRLAVVKFLDLAGQYQSIKLEIDNAVQAVIENSAFIGGRYVTEFEKNFSNYVDVSYCIGVANGTDAIEIAIESLNIPAKSEIIVPANSFIASSEAVTRTGHKVVFADVDSDSYVLSIEDVRRRITSKTKVIIAVHLYGHPCNMDKLAELANEFNLYIIEDCAQAHGSEYKGKRVGGIGDIATFSFYPGKNLGAYGDAGAIISNNDEYSMRFRLYSKHGALKKHEHIIEGVNSRMDGIQAAILNVKLNYIEDWTLKRNLNANIYLNSLNGVKEIVLPKTRANSTHSFHLFVIQAENRDELKLFLEEKQIQTAIHYPKPLPTLEAYKKYNYNLDEFPVATRLSSNILSLPMYPELQKEQIEYISESIKEFYN